ncbi:MAG TPA: RNA polymerase sigma factor [Blastocatellia bacterium]|nr:RNA polymerase sigma factor [Blastocatellia bacterium]
MAIGERRIDTEDRQLVEAAQSGDGNAFKALYERYRDRVYNLSFYSLGETLWAEDVLQIVFLKVFRGLSEFRFESEFATWIYRITLNECRNQLRRKPAPYVPLEAILGGIEESDSRDLPDAEQLERERRQIIQRALMDMSTKLRTVVVLKYVEGLSYDEIARVLECAPGTVASRLNRALSGLEARLRPLRRLL